MDRRRQDRTRSAISVSVAVALHGLLLLVPSVQREIVEIVPVLGDFVAVEAEEPPPAPPEAPAAAPQRPLERRATPPPTPTDRTPPPPANEAVEELFDVRLGNDPGAFEMPAGSGEPSGRPNASGAVTGREVAGEPGGVPGGVPGSTGIVPAADLSRLASAPGGLDERLRRNYPEEARQQGIEGSATVALEVDADGVIQRVQLVRESVGGFGFYRACASMLREAGRWAPARDVRGQPVASSPRFTCRFRVDG